MNSDQYMKYLNRIFNTKYHQTVDDQIVEHTDTPLFGLIDYPWDNEDSDINEWMKFYGGIL
jgi:hypothetical protein